MKSLEDLRQFDNWYNISEIAPDHSSTWVLEEEVKKLLESYNKKLPS